MGIKDFLEENRGAVVGLDTMAFIYLFEENENYIDAVKAVFNAVEKGELKAVTSAVTIIECLTKPLKSNDFHLVAKYKTAFHHFPNLKVIPVSTELAEKAAFIRARYGLKTPDSIQIAAAVMADTNAFITNDTDLKEIDGVEIVQLSNFRLQ